jgi:tRNA 2-thiouridine synthesizing protein A
VTSLTATPEGHHVVEVDARGLRCPIPVIRLGAAIRDLAPGSLVRLLATDPAARSDVAAFCRLRGHELVDTTDEADHTAYLVRPA